MAALRLRGLTLYEIVSGLAELGVVNPRTKKPFSKGIIHHDLQELELTWHDEASQSYDQHKATLLAGIRELRRAAWEAGDLKIVAKALQQEAQLYGLNAPLKIAPTTPDGESLESQRVAKALPLEILEAIVDARASLLSLGKPGVTVDSHVVGCLREDSV